MGQQFLHIAQAEDLQVRGRFDGDWDYERVRFPGRELTVVELRRLLTEAREWTRSALEGLDDDGLDDRVALADGDAAYSRRSFRTWR